jgi:phage terminase large subunit-like protein
MVGAYVVKVDPSTQFAGGSCGSLRIGMRIHGRGTVNADGSVSLTYLAVLN